MTRRGSRWPVPDLALGRAVAADPVAVVGDCLRLLHSAEMVPDGFAVIVSVVPLLRSGDPAFRQQKGAACASLPPAPPDALARSLSQLVEHLGGAPKLTVLRGDGSAGESH